ncbi:hypothetical protein ACFVZ3_36185 [Kitasatospora purpeofusca]|uniref:hypothetical protein n=1 Tax=Kitasatospora purpeofusca TaxID=67352 RepID=UPI00367D5DA0
MRKKLAVLGAVIGIAASAVLVAAPAQAGTIPRNGGNPGCGLQICLSYNSDAAGGWWSSDADEWQDLSGQTFHQGFGSTAWNGVGQQIKNNAAWVCNGGYLGVYLYVNSARYGWGVHDYIEPSASGNLKGPGMVTYNNEAAYSIYSH